MRKDLLQKRERKAAAAKAANRRQSKDPHSLRK
jgi:hypothetical protein